MADLIDGVKVTLGREEYTLPPLNLRLVKRFKQDGTLEKLDRGDLDAAAIVVHEALRRNYPDLPVETVEEGLDLGNLRPVLDALLARSGFVKRSPGEADRPQS